MAVRLLSDDRPVPHDLDAERAVLGAALVDPQVLATAASILRPEDFFRAAHQTIYRRMLGLQARSVDPDFITLKNELGTHGELESIGGPAYLAGLTDGMPRGANVAQHAEIIREKARFRSAIAVANRLASEAYEEDGTAARVVETAVRELSLSVEAPAGGLVTEGRALIDYVRQIDEGAGPSAPVMTGYVDLDELVGGVRPGDLVVVAARPSVGKSSFALGLAHYVASRGRAAVFFSLEMSLNGLASRLLAWRTKVPSARFERRQATSEEYARAAAAMNEFEGATRLKIEATARTVTEIGAWCRRARQEDDVACCVVDYLQMLVPERHRDSDEAEIAASINGLKRLAVDQNVVIIALSQLNRASEMRRDKRPRASDLRGSGAIEQACDLALLLYREEMHKPTAENEGIAEVIVAKNRNGPVGVVRLAFIKELAQFHNLARY